MRRCCRRFRKNRRSRIRRRETITLPRATTTPQAKGQRISRHPAIRTQTQSPVIPTQMAAANRKTPPAPAGAVRQRQPNPKETRYPANRRGGPTLKMEPPPAAGRWQTLPVKITTKQASPIPQVRRASLRSRRGLPCRMTSRDPRARQHHPSTAIGCRLLIGIWSAIFSAGVRLCLKTPSRSSDACVTSMN